MTHLFLVAVGGAAGSVCRHYLAVFLAHRITVGEFPVATWTVNVVGCLAAGIIMGLSERLTLLSAEARLLIFSGLLGGFTTFSAFAVETVTLLRRGDTGTALLYAFLSVTISLAALGLGLSLSQVIPWKGEPPV